MQLTTNLGLKKPEINEYVNVNDLNENADIVDVEIKDLKDNKADRTELTTLEGEVSAHLAEKATLTKLGHVKAKTLEDGTLILPEIKVDDKTVFLNELGELTTKHPPIDYYINGNEFNNITGGFVTGYTFGTPNGVITKNPTHLLIDNKGGTNNEWTIESNSKIDFKKINKLCVEWECPAPNSGNAHLMITDAKTKRIPLAQTVITGGNLPFGRIITELDTTNFSDSYYIAIKKLGGNLLKIYKIWGEE